MQRKVSLFTNFWLKTSPRSFYTTIFSPKPSSPRKTLEIQLLDYQFVLETEFSFISYQHFLFFFQPLAFGIIIPFILTPFRKVKILLRKKRKKKKMSENEHEINATWTNFYPRIIRLNAFSTIFIPHRHCTKSKGARGSFFSEKEKKKKIVKVKISLN